MFDGVMVSQVVDDTRSLWHGQPRELGAKDCKWHCKMLNEICKHVLGIDMNWDTKTLKDKRVAVPDDFDPGTLMLVFEEITPEFDAKNVKIGENYVNQTTGGVGKTTEGDGLGCVRNTQVDSLLPGKGSGNQQLQQC